MANRILLILTVCSLCISCNKSEEIDEQTSLIESLNQEQVPLTEDPLLWSDTELTFLDDIANSSIIGLGEATHGTAEFFKAKHRIFQYLVENHDYKVFAFEADFGESIFINEAIQTGNCAAIEDLMKYRMHFWTWRTEEVRDLLQWMCEYNIGKADIEKVQYAGVDCQYNTFHPGMLESYLMSVSPSILADFQDVLDEAKLNSTERFDNYTLVQFNTYDSKLFRLRNTMNSFAEELISKSSEQEYELNVRILDVIRQVSKVRYQRNKDAIRDQFMAENTSWLLDYFDKKVVAWAHNAHIANDFEFLGGNAMGYHLRREHGTDYTALAFLFSKGTFTARGHNGEQSTNIETQSLDSEPSIHSVNHLMSESESSVFSVEIQGLKKNREWINTVNNLVFFQLGAVFFQQDPRRHYQDFNDEYFDYIIYFDNTTASKLIPY